MNKGTQDNIVPEWSIEMVQHLRALLLGRLVEITGIIWFIDFDISRWDLKFSCHYGFGLHEVLSVALSLEKNQQYLENRLTDQAWDIAKAYWKRMRNRYVFDE